MEIQIKKAVRAGNSSAVIVPKSWLNKEVRVELTEKTDETILIEVISIIKKYLPIKDIIGVYLTGSYARGEEDENSDIDVLIVTDNIDREMISEGIYNILIISSQLLKQKLNQDLFPIGQMLKEAKPVLNSDYLNSIEVKVTKKNINWYLKTTKNKLNIIKKALNELKKKNQRQISKAVAYTLVLRIRTLYIIEKLIKNESYAKKDFMKIINKISRGTDAYEAYLAVKNNLKKEIAIPLDEIERLYEYLKNQLEQVKKLIRGKR